MKRGCLMNMLFFVGVFLLIAFQSYMILELVKRYPDYAVLTGLSVSVAGISILLVFYKLLFGSYVNLKLLSGIKEYDDARSKGLIKEPSFVQLIWNKTSLIIYVQLITKHIKLSIPHMDIVSIQSRLIGGVSPEKAEYEAAKGAILGAIIGGKYGAFVGAGMGFAEKQPRIITSLNYKAQDGSAQTLNFIYPFEERFKENFFKKHYKDIYTQAESI